MYALVGGCLLCKCVIYGCTHCGLMKGWNAAILGKQANWIVACLVEGRIFCDCMHTCLLDRCMLTGLLHALLLRQNACMHPELSGYNNNNNNNNFI